MEQAGQEKMVGTDGAANKADGAGGGSRGSAQADAGTGGNGKLARASPQEGEDAPCKSSAQPGGAQFSVGPAFMAPKGGMPTQVKRELLQKLKDAKLTLPDIDSQAGTDPKLRADLLERRADIVADFLPWRLDTAALDQELYLADERLSEDMSMVMGLYSRTKKLVQEVKEQDRDR
jgi:hypothetical protein